MRTMQEIAVEVKDDWKNINPYAKAYLDTFGRQRDEDAILYFLSNAGSWRGETARRIKAELKARLG